MLLILMPKPSELRLRLFLILLHISDSFLIFHRDASFSFDLIFQLMDHFFK